MKKVFFVLVLSCASIASGFSQVSQSSEFLYSNKFSILAGLIQPLLLKGGNIEVNYFTDKMSFDYSHGFSLNPPTVGTYKDQNISLHLPFSTGFGVGYRFSSFFDIRFEPKLHSWELYYKDAEQTEANKIKDFKTITLGFGAYYRYFPFKNSESTFLQGFELSSSIRYWQNVGTTLTNDEIIYANKTTNKTETLKAPSIGLANTPLIINIGIGYTFGGK